MSNLENINRHIFIYIINQLVYMSIEVTTITINHMILLFMHEVKFKLCNRDHHFMITCTLFLKEVKLQWVRYENFNSKLVN